MLLSLTLLFCLTTVSAAPGDTIYVSGSGNDSWDGSSTTHTDKTLIGPKLSIKNATGTVNTNGTIHIANGQYTVENNTNITIDKNMNIIGESQSGTILNGTGTNWMFHVVSGVNVTITNLTLTNATTTVNGGAIYNQGSLTVTNCTFTGNTADCGGFIYNEGTFTANNCTLTNNTAIAGGAIYNCGGNLNLSGCNLTNNTATSGGAIFNNYYGHSDSAASLDGCNITSNTATNYGGAILNNGNLTVKYNLFYNNTSPSGNAIYHYAGSMNATLNWWGSNLDPKSITNLIVGDVDNVNTSSWLFMTVTATPSKIYKGQSSEIIVSFNNYSSDGIHYTSLPEPLEGYIPDGTPVIFSNALGSFNPENPVTISGNAATSFTPSCHSGTAIIYATVDGFSLNTPITVSNSNIYVSNSTGSDTTGDGSQNKPYQTINKGISMVTSGGTVHIADGIYTGTGNTNLIINKNMNIIGESQTGTIINGTGTNWMFVVYGGTDVTITNLTLTNGKAGLTDMYGYFHVGGAIVNYGTLSVNGCTFTGNNADCGGAIYNPWATLSVNNCTFTGNTANNDGGAIYNQGGTINSVSGCIFKGNNADYGGGAIEVDLTGDIKNLSDCNFIDNTASEGGAINNVGTINSLNGCTFTGNTAVNGGAIYNLAGTISLSGCNFTKNTATNGGAICNDYYYLSDSKVTLDGCNITSNTATTYGGAIYNGGILTANYNRFYNNTATDGTAIYFSRGSVNANYNWWSSNKDPKTIKNLIYDPGNLVNATYWVILSVNTPPNSIDHAQNTTITADLNHYTNSTGYVGELSTHIPDGQITLSIPWGSFTNSGITHTTTSNTINNAVSAVFYANEGTLPESYDPVKVTASADDYTTNNTESAYITINKITKLYLKTKSSSNNPKVGEKFLLTYKLGNYGPDAADNVTVTFQLPEGLDFVNIHVDNGKCTYEPTTRTVTWTLDSVPVGDPYLYLTVKAATTGNYQITPKITSGTYNLNSGDYGIITFNVQPNNNNTNNGTPNSKITVNAASKITKTVGLQDTGLPLNYLLLAVLMVLSGLVPRRK